MNVVTLTDDNFETEVNASDKPVLVDYWAKLVWSLQDGRSNC